MKRIKYKELFLKLFFIWLKYTILVAGLLSLLHFWKVDLEKIGFWNFIFGSCIWTFADAVSGKVKYKDEEEE